MKDSLKIEFLHETKDFKTYDGELNMNIEKPKNIHHQ